MQARPNEPAEAASTRRTVAIVLGALLAIAVVFGSLGVGGVTLIARSMKRSEAYQTTLGYLRSAPRVQADLGSPIEDGFMPSGRIASSGSTGSADLTISLSGPKGEGRARVTLEKGLGGWNVTRVEWASAGRVTTLAGGAPLP